MSRGFFNERRTAAPAASRSHTLGITASSGVGAAAAAATTVITAATTAAGTTGQIVTLLSASACSAASEHPVCSRQTLHNPLMIAGSACAAHTAVALRTTLTAATTACSGVNAGDHTADPGMPSHTRETAASASPTAVMLTLSACSAATARDEHTIVR